MLGTLKVDDLVIPFAEQQEQRFYHTWDHYMDPMMKYHTFKRQEHVISIDKPQEVYMWENFGKLVNHCRAGGKPDMRWLAESYITHTITINIDTSTRKDNQYIPCDWSFYEKTFGQ